MSLDGYVNGWYFHRRMGFHLDYWEDGRGWMRVVAGEFVKGVWVWCLVVSSRRPKNRRRGSAQNCANSWKMLSLAVGLQHARLARKRRI